MPGTAADMRRAMVPRATEYEAMTIRVQRPRAPALTWYDLTLREQACFPHLESSPLARGRARFERRHGVAYAKGDAALHDWQAAPPLADLPAHPPA